jgi:16S rRNA (adenine1518-N6/adenine1519-N6)-dimethyltransferase
VQNNLSSPAAVSSLLRRHNFLPAHKLGQNFLVDANILAKIVAAGELESGDVVIEVGTGLGVLTRALADQVGQGGRVITVERDPRLSAILAETLPAEEFPQVRIVAGDVLDVDLTKSVEVHAAGVSQRSATVVANIPYSITSPLVARLLQSEPPFRTIVLLVQKEVGERLAAAAGSSDYGAFSVFVQYYAAVDIVASVSPTVFYPPPKVTSAIVRLRPRADAPVAVLDTALLFRIVQTAFQQRRKTLLNALSSELLGWGKARAQAVLIGAGIDQQRRGETLSLQEFASIERSSWNESAPNSV